MLGFGIAQRTLQAVFACLCLFLSAAWAAEPARLHIPILVYHRFGPEAGEMMVSRATFLAQLEWLRDHDYAVVPLRAVVDYRLGRAPPPPARAVVITADDGNRSVYTEMFPLVRRFGIPVTLFIYPSAISRASYALTWEELRTLQASGLFDIGSHTYWHPNFRTERARLPADQYERLVAFQLSRSREVLESKLGRPVDLLAWPYGIHDGDLPGQAGAQGYVAAFGLERRHATDADDVMALPRYLVTEADRGAAFARLVAGGEERP